jgi:hypothetical protein
VHLHFAAACQLEKTIWTAAIQDAISADGSAWVNEPIENFPPDARSIITAYEDPPLSASDWSTPLPMPLPTIQSMSEIETRDDPSSPAPPASSPRKVHRTMPRVDSAIMRHDALNRRTSTSSVKAFFSPLTFESRVSRPSTQIRQQVDHGLHDVISETFVTVRSQARMRDEELFQLRKKQGNVSRSNSGLTLSGAFTPRRRQDSMALSNSRRKGSLDGIPDVTSDSETIGKSVGLAMLKRSKSSGGKRRIRQSLSVANHISQIGSEFDMRCELSPDGLVELPPAMTQSSSAMSSNVNSVLPSPLEMTMPLPNPASTGTIRRGDGVPKRTRSLVDNVRSLFHTRSISPAPSTSPSPKILTISLDADMESHGGLLQWWRRGSLRRRVQSSPEVPMDDSAPVTPAASSDDGAYSDLTSNSSTNPTSPLPSPDSSTERGLSRSNSRRVAFSAVAPVVRRRSLFAATSRTEGQTLTRSETSQSLSRSKTLKNMFQFQRSNSFTPADDRLS